MAKTTEIPLKECSAYGQIDQGGGGEREETDIYEYPQWLHNYTKIYKHAHSFKPTIVYPTVTLNTAFRQLHVIIQLPLMSLILVVMCYLAAWSGY